jgi:hypothetical protein
MQWLPLAAAIVVSSLVSVLVAVAVAWMALPNQDELQRQVASDLGVPPAILEVPLVAQALDAVTARAQRSVLDASRDSLALGAAAGASASLALSYIVASRVWTGASRRRSPE